MQTPAPRGQSPKPDFKPASAPDTSADQRNSEGRFSKSNLRRFWKEQIWPTIVLVAVLLCMRSSLADWNVVPTGSMNPTIIEGDRIFVNKLAYDLKVPFTTWHIAQWSDPKRGEIIVFDSPEDGIRLVKRVIAVPGDRVQLINNRLYINSHPASYGTLDPATANEVRLPERQTFMLEFATETVDGVTHAVMANDSRPSDKRNYGPITVPSGQYFVMGDNRDNSKDSRYIGFVPRANIVGRSSCVLMSLNYDNHYLPRSERFFRKLP
jgi:signal peptidase I